MMKIAVVGAGAIGSVVGGLLSRAGGEVTLIGRRSHIEAIDKNGLIIEGVPGTIHVKVKTAEHLDFKPDLVFLTVKTQDVEEAVREIRPFVTGVPVVTMQNGVQSDRIVAAILGKDNIFSCVIMFAGTFLEPGKVTYSNISDRGSVLIGSPCGPGGKRLEDIATLLNKAIPTRSTQDIASAHWTKLLLNLNNAIPAVTGLPMQDAYTYPQARLLSIELLKEGVRVLRSAGIRPAPVPGIPLSAMRLMVNMPRPLASLILKRQIRASGSIPVYGSTLQSIKRGKKTEIDYLNGEIVRLGERTGVETPYNSLIVDLVHRVETTGKFLTAGELSEKLAHVRER